MRLHSFALSAFLSLVLLLSPCALVVAQGADVLMFGNSYTQRNNLMGLLRDLLKTQDPTTSVNGALSGGKTIGWHATELSRAGSNHETRHSNLNAGDVLFLQDQSQVPSCTCFGSYPASLAGTKSIRVATPSSIDMIMYMTWGRRDGLDGNSFNNCYSEMQERLRVGYEAYRDEALSAGNGNVYIAPVGYAFKKLHDEELCNPDPSPATCQGAGLTTGCATTVGSDFMGLYTSDRSHPSLRGSYLTACVMFATMTGISPVGLPGPSTMDAADIAKLQNVAKSVVLDDSENLGYTYSWSGSPTDSPVMVPPTDAPVVPPTDAPVVPPTDAPVVPPTDAPVVPPTDAPVVPPTDAPVVPPTDAPVVPPTDAPVVPPTDAPVVPPTDAPVVPPTDAPVVPPTDAPVVPPTDAPVVPPTDAPVVPPTDAPVVPPTDAPVVPPTDAPVVPTFDWETCDDDETAKFDHNGKLRTCGWLRYKSQNLKNNKCSDPTIASLCQETCGLCNDSCVDDTSAVFDVNNRVTGKNCKWVAQSIKRRNLYCTPDNVANYFCRETCESCHESFDSFPSAAPSAELPDPLADGICQDDDTVRFEWGNQLKNCKWLRNQASKPNRKQTVCVPENDAYWACEATCDRCVV